MARLCWCSIPPPKVGIRIGANLGPARHCRQAQSLAYRSKGTCIFAIRATHRPEFSLPHPVDRNPISIALSTDNGTTWSSQRNLQDGNSKDVGQGVGKSSLEFSYPTVLQTSDGAIHIMYGDIPLRFLDCHLVTFLPRDKPTQNDWFTVAAGTSDIRPTAAPPEQHLNSMRIHGLVLLFSNPPPSPLPSNSNTVLCMSVLESSRTSPPARYTYNRETIKYKRVTADWIKQKSTSM